MQKAKEKGMLCVGILGKNGGKVRNLCDIAILVPSDNTQRIQEIHTCIIHILSDIVEKSLSIHTTDQTYKQPEYGFKGGKAQAKTLKKRGQNE